MTYQRNPSSVELSAGEDVSIGSDTDTPLSRSALLRRNQRLQLQQAPCEERVCCEQND